MTPTEWNYVQLVVIAALWVRIVFLRTSRDRARAELEEERRKAWNLRHGRRPEPKDFDRFGGPRG